MKLKNVFLVVAISVATSLLSIWGYGTWMSKHTETGGDPHDHATQTGPLARRDFFKSSAAGLAAGAAAAGGLTTFEALTRKVEAAERADDAIPHRPVVFREQLVKILRGAETFRPRGPVRASRPEH